MNALARDLMCPHQAQAMRDLWASVLISVLSDLNPTRSHSLEYRQAHSWLGSSDFRTVCSLAGMDPEAINDAVRAKIARGEPIRFTACG